MKKIVISTTNKNKIERIKMEVEIDGHWVKYNDLDDNELVALDSDLYDSIMSMLNEISKM